MEVDKPSDQENGNQASIVADAEERMKEASDISESEPSRCIDITRELLSDEKLRRTAEGAKIVEQAVYLLGKTYAAQQDTERLVQLMTDVRPFFTCIPKARTAKVVRTLMDLVAKTPDSLGAQLSLCKEAVEWCTQKKRTFLRQRLQSRLVDLLLKHSEYADALELIKTLVMEVKKIDDKLMLVEIHLTEARVHHAVENLAKAKAALTAARTNSNAIYVPPALQAQIDMMAGVLNTELEDFDTAFSYYFEAFEAFDGQKEDDPRTLQCLSYMVLCRIMVGNYKDVGALVAGKHGIKYACEKLNALKSVSEAYKDRSLKHFMEARKVFKSELDSDQLVKKNLDNLYDTMLEQNLIRIVEPYSCVEISHVAACISMDKASVESKLSQMILDGKMLGILDQGRDVLILYDAAAPSKVYEDSVGTIRNMDVVVTNLFTRAKHITA